MFKKILAILLSLCLWPCAAFADLGGITGVGTISAATVANGVQINVSGYSEISFAVTGTWSGTITFADDDGSGTYPWTFLPCFSSAGVTVSSITSNISVICPVGPHPKFAIYFSAYTSGSATIQYNLGAVPSSITASGGTAIVRGGTSGVTTLNQCDTSVPVNISTATTTQLIAAPSSNLHVCGYILSITGTTPTAQFESGTGGTCGTSTATLTGVLPTGVYPIGAGVGQVFTSLFQTALCIVSTGTPSIQGEVFYTTY